MICAIHPWFHYYWTLHALLTLTGKPIWMKLEKNFCDAGTACLFKHARFTIYFASSPISSELTLPQNSTHILGILQRDFDRFQTQFLQPTYVCKLQRAHVKIIPLWPFPSVFIIYLLCFTHSSRTMHTETTDFFSVPISLSLSCAECMLTTWTWNLLLHHQTIAIMFSNNFIHH